MTTTTRLKTPRARWIELQPPVAAAICIFALLLIGLIVGRMRSAPVAAAVPTPALPIILFATPAPGQPTPAPIQVAAVLPRFVVCYDQPVNGAVLGPIPAPDASAVVARYGTSWVMTPWNGGYCWLHAADVGLPDVADLEPTAAPAVVYVSAPEMAVATPTEQQYAVTSAQPPAAPVQWATSGPIRKEDFVAPDPKAACAFVGCLR